MKPEKPKITSRNVEKLLKELSPGYNHQTKISARIRSLEADYDELEKKLLSSPKLIALHQTIRELRDEHQKIVNANVGKVAKIRKRYWAEGATPRVLKALEAMLDEEEALDDA